METESKYIKGFNTGYLISKYENDLLIKLEKNFSKSNDFFQGFAEGSEEVKLEFEKKQYFNFKEIRKKGKDLGPFLSID